MFVALMSIVVVIISIVSGSAEHIHKNENDQKAIQFVKKVLRKLVCWRGTPQGSKSRPTPFRKGLLEQAMFIISDQMIISGLAFNSIAFGKIRVLSLYHFAILTDLGWFAANAHQTTIILLAPTMHKHKSTCAIRAVIMWVTALLQLGVSVVFGNQSYNSQNVSCRALCILPGLDPRTSFRGSWLAWMVVNIYLVLWGTTRTTLLLYPRSSSWIYRLGEDGVTWLYHKEQATKDTQHTPMAFLLGAARKVLRCLMCLLQSHIASVCHQIVWFGIGTVSLLNDRLHGPESAKDWAVAQILQILLLFVPILTLVEVYERMSFAVAVLRRSLFRW